MFIMAGARPVRVQTAMDFVSLMMGTGNNDKASPQEAAAYNASLEALRMYFTGEMDYGDLSAFRSAGHPEALAEQAQQSMFEAFGSAMESMAESKEPKAAETKDEPPAPAEVQ
jgi:hypothetical protein